MDNLPNDIQNTSSVDTDAISSQRNNYNLSVAYIHSQDFELHLNKHPRLLGTVTIFF